MFNSGRSTETGRTTVVGLFHDSGRARDAVEALKDAGFSGNDIGILMRDRDEAKDMAKETGTEAGAGAATGLIGGGILGGLAGWLVGIGALVIPGVGPFIAAGALGAALTGAAIGAGVGAIAGALVGMGIPKEEAEWYENEVRGGRTMVTVHGDGRYTEARSIMRRYGAYDIENRTPEQMGTTSDMGTGMRTGTSERGGIETGRTGRNDYGTGTSGSYGMGSSTSMGAMGDAGTTRRNWNDVSSRYRGNWERRYGSSGGRWEDSEPNYRYGWEMRDRPEYKGRSWQEVEPQFRRDWEGRHQGKPWDRAMENVREAWEDMTDDERSMSGSAEHDFGRRGTTTTGQTRTGTFGEPAAGTTIGSGWSDYSTRYRSNWESRYGSSGGRWEDYEPGYRYGWEMSQRPEYRGRKWNEVETDFRSDWTRTHPDTPWERISSSIREAWEDLTGSDKGGRGGTNLRGDRTEFGPR